MDTTGEEIKSLGKPDDKEPFEGIYTKATADAKMDAENMQIGSFGLDFKPFTELAPTELPTDKLKKTWVGPLLPWTADKQISAEDYAKQIWWNSVDFYFAVMNKTDQSVAKLEIVRPNSKQVTREFWHKVDKIYSIRQSRDGQFRCLVFGYTHGLKYMFLFQTTLGVQIYAAPTWIMLQKSFTQDARTAFLHLVLEGKPELCLNEPYQQPPNITSDFEVAWGPGDHPFRAVKKIEWNVVEDQPPVLSRDCFNGRYSVFYASPMLDCFAGQFDARIGAVESPYFFRVKDQVLLASTYSLLVTFALDDIHRERLFHDLRANRSQGKLGTKRDADSKAVPTSAPSVSTVKTDKDGDSTMGGGGEKKSFTVPFASDDSHPVVKSMKDVDQDPTWSDSSIPVFTGEVISSEDRKQMFAKFQQAYDDMKQIPVDQLNAADLANIKELEDLQRKFEDLAATSESLASMGKDEKEEAPVATIDVPKTDKKKKKKKKLAKRSGKPKKRLDEKKSAPVKPADVIHMDDS